MAKGGFLTATRALGMGMDFLGVVYIVHVGIPYRLINFAQESGHGGRNGEAVDSIILLDRQASACSELEGLQCDRCGEGLVGRVKPKSRFY